MIGNFRSKYTYSIKHRILIVFVLLVMLPSILLIVNFTNNYSNYALKSIIREKQILLEEMDKNIELQLMNYRDVSMSIYYNSITRDYIDQENYDKMEEYIPLFLSSIVNTEKYIVSAVLEINGCIYSAGYQYRNLDYYFNKHRETVIEKKGKVQWIPTENLSASFSQNLHHFTIARAVNSPNGMVGVLWLFLSEDLFHYILDNTILQEDGSYYYIISPKGEVVTSNDENIVGTVAMEALFSEALEKGNGYFTYQNAKTGTKEIVVSSTSSTTGWTTLITIEEYIAFRDLNNIKTLAFTITFFYIIFFVVAYYLLSNSVFSHLGKLSKGMKKASNGIFEKICIKNSNDEIGMLISTYNYMIDKIECLMVDIRNEEQAKNEEKIKVLSMQIGPHFVYNTLNTIKWMAVANKQTNIKKMIESLIMLMMSVTYNTNEENTLEEEITLLNSYVYIQKIRFLNFDIEYEMDDDIKKYKLIKLMLQPFVENCILHGFTEEPKRFVIKIKAYKDQDLFIEIHDNGKGFDTSTLSAQSIENKNERIDHIGIVNVIERIRLYYGDEYTVTIHSVIGEGTTVIIKLPLINGGNGDVN